MIAEGGNVFPHSLEPSNAAPRHRRLVLAAWISLALASGCASTDPPVLEQQEDNQVVYATTKCEVGNADGQRCDKKTCKTDSESNCEYFASRCLATGHHYSGTKDAGTCTRAHDNDRPS
jgi:hypothetical protein